jgi:hypothetical protein
VIPEWLGEMPQWLVLGAVLGVVSSCGVAGLFFVVDRLFPTPTNPRTQVDSESVRRAEIRAYLDEIGEPYAENHFVAGQHVAFYLPNRDVAITFDARAFFRIEHTDTYPVLVEHEMPGVSIGARLPFETPEVDFGPEEEVEEEIGREQTVDPAVAAFSELGLPANAEMDDVKSAYRQRVKEVHPDQGGSEQEFRRVREAYTTAKQHAS